MVTGRRKYPANPIRLFTTGAQTPCNCFARPDSGFRAVNQYRASAFLAPTGLHQRVVQCNKQVLAMSERPLTIASRLTGTSSIGKELPMELTASITAILAIMSFSFLAAIILGMI